MIFMNGQKNNLSGFNENDDDAKAAARAIDLYKADRNIKTKSTRRGNAAEAVSSKNRGRPQSDLRGNKIKESDVQRMSTADYEKNQDAIMEAVRGGDFIYDVSGSAR